MQMIGFILLGLAAGGLSGITGIGGGIIVVPALIYIFGYTSHMAQGTTLAMLVPPIGIMAAWAYYQKGYVDISVAALMAVGFVVGSYFSAKLALDLPEVTLRRIFAGFLLVIAIKMFLDNPTKTM